MNVREIAEEEDYVSAIDADIQIHQKLTKTNKQQEFVECFRLDWNQGGNIGLGSCSNVN